MGGERGQRGRGLGEKRRAGRVNINQGDQFSLLKCAFLSFYRAMHALLTEHVLAGARPDRLAAFCLARVVAAPPCLADEYKMRQRAPFRLRDERGLTLHLGPVIHAWFHGA